MNDERRHMAPAPQRDARPPSRVRTGFLLLHAVAMLVVIRDITMTTGWRIFPHEIGISMATTLGDIASSSNEQHFRRSNPSKSAENQRNKTRLPKENNKNYRTRVPIKGKSGI